MEFHREVDNSATLLRAQTHVWNHTLSFINSMSLKCAVDLGIPDAIHKYGQPMPLSQLVASLSIHPSKTNNVYRLMQLLTHSGFFSKQNVMTKDDIEEVGYVLTDASILLLKDNPLSMTPLLPAMLDPVLTKPWYQLPAWFRNNDPTPFGMEHGMMIWDYAGQEPKLNHFFNEAMASDARLVTCSEVFDKFKEVFRGLDSVVDVGGGTGIMAKAIAKSFPQTECTVFDLPHVVDGLHGCDNLRYVGGDMFESIPPANAILLKWILHVWNDEECVKILKKCKAAITSNKGKERKVIVIDMIMDNGKEDDESVETRHFLDVLMMVLYTGKERNENELAKLIYSAGFSNYKITPVLGLRSLIEIYP